MWVSIERKAQFTDVLETTWQQECPWNSEEESALPIEQLVSKLDKTGVTLEVTFGDNESYLAFLSNHNTGIYYYLELSRISLIVTARFDFSTFESARRESVFMGVFLDKLKTLDDSLPVVDISASCLQHVNEVAKQSALQQFTQFQHAQQPSSADDARMTQKQYNF